MFRRNLSLTLLTVAFLSGVGALVSACSGGGAGGGNSAAPCCAAQGQVDPPPPAFAGGESLAGLQVRPVIVDSADCPSFSEPLETLLDLPSASKPADVDPVTGEYSLTLNEKALGKKIAFVACSDNCDVVRGVGFLGAEVAPTAEGEFLVVAPIQLSTSSGALGPSTLEVLADCELDVRDIRGDLITADVRHVITRLVRYPAAPTTGEVNDLMSRLQLFDDGMQIAITATGAQPGVFAQARTDIEGLVDRCETGEQPLPGCLSAAPTDAEFFRYYQIARIPFTVVATPAPTATAAPGPLPPEDDMGPFYLQTWAQQLSDNLGPNPPAASDALALSMLKQDVMFRYELMRKRVQDAIATPIDRVDTGAPVTISMTLTTGGAVSIQQSFDGIRSAILDGSMDTPQSISSAWQTGANQIARNIDTQLGVAGSLVQNLMTQCIAHGADVHATLDAGSTPQQALAAIYSDGSGSGGAYQLCWDEVGTALAGRKLTEQIAVTEIVFFIGANASAPVGAPLGFQ